MKRSAFLGYSRINDHESTPNQAAIASTYHLEETIPMTPAIEPTEVK